MKVFGTKASERPFQEPYRPEMDVAKILGDGIQYWYLKLTGVIIWEIELDRIGIMTKISVLPQNQCNTSEIHLNALYMIFWYLKCELSRSKNPNVGRLVFDAHPKEVYDRLFTHSPQDQWNAFYPDDEDLLPPNIPKPRCCWGCIS